MSDETDALERWGDALRRGVALRAEERSLRVRRWTVDELDRVAARMAHTLEACLVAGDARAVALARDRAESARRGIAIAALRSRIPSADLAQRKPLTDACQRAEAWLASAVTSDEVREILADRAAMHRGGSWIDALPDPRIEPESPADEDIARAALPTTDAIVAFARDGSFARWILAAAEEPSVRAGLVELLRELALDAPRSLLARRFMQGPSGALRVGSRPPRTLAADTGDAGGGVESELLGALHPTRAFARLVRSHAALEVRVLADAGVIADVRWGEARGRNEPLGQLACWTVSRPWGAPAATLRVRDVNGALFEETIACSLEDR